MAIRGRNRRESGLQDRTAKNNTNGPGNRRQPIRDGTARNPIQGKAKSRARLSSATSAFDKELTDCGKRLADPRVKLMTIGSVLRKTWTGRMRTSCEKGQPARNQV
jgi:hypothetical protein